MISHFNATFGGTLDELDIVANFLLLVRNELQRTSQVKWGIAK